MNPIETKTAAYLGPARVVQAAAGRVQVELPNDYAWATCAIAFPYQPIPDDVVLVIGPPENCYVIGVIQGSAPTQFTVPADLHLKAPNGKVEIEAGRGVRIKAPRVRLAAIKLEFVAKTVFERFENAARWVREAFKIRAGRTKTTVEGEHRLTADRIVELAKNNVKIDGSKIDLG